MTQTALKTAHLIIMLSVKTFLILYCDNKTIQTTCNVHDFMTMALTNNIAEHCSQKSLSAVAKQ